MQLVLQRVREASVRVDGEVVGSIGRGIMALVGIAEDDSENDVTWAIDRITKTALWPEHIAQDEGRPWTNSVVTAQLDVLCVSQFTLCGKLKKVKKGAGSVSFHRAMPPGPAETLYNDLLANLRSSLPDTSKVQDGRFGKRMLLSLCNDGPVTLTLDSRHGNGLTPVVPSSVVTEASSSETTTTTPKDR